MKRHLYLFVSILIFTATAIKAQFIANTSVNAFYSSDEPYREDFVYGFQAGATRSQISGLDRTILSEPYFINYKWSYEKRTGFAFGGYINYRSLIKDHLGFQCDLMYAQQGAGLKFNNYEKDFYYDMEFKYQYVNIAPSLVFYPFDRDNYGLIAGLNLNAGAQFGINVTPENITYKSGGPGYLPAFGSDLEQQQQLRNVLKGRNTVSFAFGAGWEFPKVSVSFKVFKGMSDVTETQSNSYNFIENENLNVTKQLTVGVYFH